MIAQMGAGDASAGEGYASVQAFALLQQTAGMPMPYLLYCMYQPHPAVPFQQPPSLPPSSCSPLPAPQIASALAYLHARNIVLLDLKPGNVMLLSEDSLTMKLSDYGFATARERTSALGRRASSFMAPELRQVGPCSTNLLIWGLNTAYPQY